MKTDARINPGPLPPLPDDFIFVRHFDPPLDPTKPYVYCTPADPYPGDPYPDDPYPDGPYPEDLKGNPYPDDTP